jgi:hypothetical protein
MSRTTILLLVSACLALLSPDAALAQVFESVGTRALGMGGAFVGVADDATAIYWNPAGLATGAFFDLRLEGQRTERVADPVSGGTPGGARNRTLFLGLAVPSLGVAYLRTCRAEIGPPGTAAAGAGSRQEDRPSTLPLGSLVADHVAVTLVQSLTDRVVVGGTLRVVRGEAGRVLVEADRDPGAQLDAAEHLAGRSSRRVDVDLGVMARHGVVRVGLVARNLAAPTFPVAEPGEPMRLARQVRAGLAFMPGEGSLTLAVDADLTRTPLVAGDRRNVAVGIERWLWNRQVAVRGGVRAGTVGPARAVAAAGASVAVRSGVFIEGQVARGRADADRSWGLTGRVTF